MVQIRYISNLNTESKTTPKLLILEMFYDLDVTVGSKCDIFEWNTKLILNGYSVCCEYRCNDGLF